MTYDEQIEVIQAMKDGFCIERRLLGNNGWWSPMHLHGDFDFVSNEYRIVKPKEKTLHPAFGAGDVVRDPVEPSVQAVIMKIDTDDNIVQICEEFFTVKDVIKKFEFKHEGKWISCES